MSDRAAIEDFQTYAKLLDGDEKSEAQVFLDRLFIGFGHKGYKEAGATLEARIRRNDGNTSFADLRWGNRALFEMKKRGANLKKHYPYSHARAKSKFIEARKKRARGHRARNPTVS